MATIYKNIQIKSKDIYLIKESLIKYKQRFEEKFKEIDNRIYSITPILSFYNAENIKMLVSKELDYVTLIVHNRIFDYELAIYLSGVLDCLCLYVEFYDFEFYRILIYVKGKFQTVIIRKDETISDINIEGTFDFELCCNVLDLDNSQREYLLKAINTSDIFDSFLELENALNTLLCIDFDHTNKKIIEEYKNSGSKWYFI